MKIIDLCWKTSFAAIVLGVMLTSFFTLFIPSMFLIIKFLDYLFTLSTDTSLVGFLGLFVILTLGSLSICLAITIKVIYTYDEAFDINKIFHSKEEQKK